MVFSHLFSSFNTGLMLIETNKYLKQLVSILKSVGVQSDALALFSECIMAMSAVGGIWMHFNVCC